MYGCLPFVNGKDAVKGSETIVASKNPAIAIPRTVCSAARAFRPTAAGRITRSAGAAAANAAGRDTNISISPLAREATACQHHHAGAGEGVAHRRCLQGRG